MTLPQLNFSRAAYEWKPFHNKAFSIEVRAWGMMDKWIWNVYAYIPKTHPLFHDPAAAVKLPFHRGCTFSKKYAGTGLSSYGEAGPTGETSEYLKIGCDYNHYMDDWANSSNPQDGVPMQIIDDVQELFEALAARLPQGQEL